jgi:hypothetical protein
VSSAKVDYICASACSSFVSYRGILSGGNDGGRGCDIPGQVYVERQLLNNQGARLVLAGHNLQVKAIAEPFGLTALDVGDPAPIDLSA